MLDGEPATAITAPALRLAGTLTLWLLLALPLLGGGLTLLLGGAIGAGVLLAGAGAFWLVPVALTAAGRICAGGVWLTPSAVVVRDHGLESRIVWSGLATVAGGEDPSVRQGVVLLRASATAGGIHRRRSRPWPISVQTAGPSIAVIDARWLSVDAPALAGAIRHYQRSGTASELGSPASLRTLERFTPS
ncbi:hypothetical protein [Cellulomonas soli]|uniref:hypothetical protein n=1 Tax=Cellulomonas soli TaxID=931535 RepID=UPI0011BDC77D|nr:hypothetical protein [Cellulomonas soli]NYI58896.1 hypothetical protein [Cellulomonas soli]